MEDSIVEYSQQFNAIFHEINTVYEDYARQNHISYTSLYILTYIYLNEGCTQKQISDHTLLPKQTVHNVITEYYKKGYLGLKELPENRRAKTITYTEEGRQFAAPLIPAISQAEISAMEKLSPQEREELVKGMKAYMEAFRKSLL